MPRILTNLHDMVGFDLKGITGSEDDLQLIEAVFDGGRAGGTAMIQIRVSRPSSSIRRRS